MINLGGNGNGMNIEEWYDEIDDNIRDELNWAGIKIGSCMRNSSGEVKYAHVGKLGEWTFTRGWNYWRAYADKGRGLPLKIAEELYKEKFVDDNGNLMDNQHETYGDIIIVGDYNTNTVTPEILCRIGENSGTSVDVYRITWQNGLNKFAETVRGLS